MKIEFLFVGLTSPIYIEFFMEALLRLTAQLFECSYTFSKQVLKRLKTTKLLWVPTKFRAFSNLKSKKMKFRRDTSPKPV